MTVKKLSTNFTLQELCFSQTALNHGWVEQQLPTGSVIQNLNYLANKCLEPIRAKFGKFSPTSGYRCKRLNDAKNSTDASFHLIGCAADINLGTKEKNKKLFEWIKDNLEFTELINEFNFSWVHVAIQKGRENERKVKIIK
jgi:zinc D-Ala-D-Ala carboxypeptidase